MPVQGTILLDSGAFLQEIAPGTTPKIEIGYFNSDDGVSDLQVFADGQPIDLGNVKLGGDVEVRHTGAGARAAGVEITRAFADGLLRIRDLYENDCPKIKKEAFDCRLVLTSGRICGSMVKQRAFKPFSVTDLVRQMSQPTIAPKPEPIGDPKIITKCIPHNLAVHFDLDDGDYLELVDSGGNVIFSTRQLPAGTRRFEMELIADNTTCMGFYHKALDLTNHKTCWMPNQGDPPPMGPP